MSVTVRPWRADRPPQKMSEHLEQTLKRTAGLLPDGGLDHLEQLFKRTASLLPDAGP